jgi:hypothetical protein
VGCLNVLSSESEEVFVNINEADFEDTDQRGGIHELGFRKGDEVVVCSGDDRPDCFVRWLESLVNAYRDLYWTADGKDLGPELRALRIPEDVIEFLDAIGVELRARPWTGSLISGTWYHGWIRDGSEREVEARGQEIVDRLRALVGGQH